MIMMKLDQKIKSLNLSKIPIRCARHNISTTRVT